MKGIACNNSCIDVCLTSQVRVFANILLILCHEMRECHDASNKQLRQVSACTTIWKEIFHHSVVQFKKKLYLIPFYQFVSRDSHDGLLTPIIELSCSSPNINQPTIEGGFPWLIWAPCTADVWATLPQKPPRLPDMLRM